MVKEVIPELSCPVALFTYYNPILKRGIANFMTVVKEAGVHGNVSYYIVINNMNLLMFFYIKMPFYSYTHLINLLKYDAPSLVSQFD